MRPAVGVLGKVEVVDFASELALFLVRERGSVLGVWVGYLTADQQRVLLVATLGKAAS